MNTVRGMREAVFFDGTDARRKISRFWTLLVLSAIIAAAGVVADSTATVIGAMIVAPLITPITGVVLGTVLGDRLNTFRSWAFVLGGALTAIAIGYLVALLVAAPVTAATNTQVSSRVTPHLIDLLAALATGVVGAIALVRKDISDTLPGVAIAISLVPPLSVIGISIESGAYDQALGALLLFVTNVAAILATGVVVLLTFRVHPDTARVPARSSRVLGARYSPVITMVASLILIAIPLTATSVGLTAQTIELNAVRQAITPWAADNDWTVADVTSGDGALVNVRLTGTPPLPETDTLVDALRAAGVDPADVHLEFVPAYEIQLE